MVTSKESLILTSEGVVRSMVSAAETLVAVRMSMHDAASAIKKIERVSVVVPDVGVEVPVFVFLVIRSFS